MRTFVYRRLGALLAVCATYGCAGGAAGRPPAPQAPKARDAAADADARCAVWNRELSFAASARAHDERAFSEHVGADALFVEGKGWVQGRDAVVTSWRPIIAGNPMTLYWHPTTAHASAAAGLALTSGPYLVEDTRADAAARFRKGTFESFWKRDADGAWRVKFDHGTPPAPATDEEVAQIMRELHAPCD